MSSFKIQLAAAVLSAVCLAALPVSQAAPAGSSAASAPAASPTAPYASDNPNRVLWTDTEVVVPQAVRGTLGATVLGPQNIPLDLQNADLLAPPSTDSGTVYVFNYLLERIVRLMHGYSGNAKWPFSLSHNRLQTGGWARQQNGK